MPETLYGLTESDLLRLRSIVQSVERSDSPPLAQRGRRSLIPSRIIIGALTSAAAATTALLGKPKVATLNVYTFSSTGVEDTGIDETVYNFAPQAATTNRWTIAERDDVTGKFIITTQFCS